MILTNDFPHCPQYKNLSDNFNITYHTGKISSVRRMKKKMGKIEKKKK